jgi:hypothetical protein
MSIHSGESTCRCAKVARWQAEEPESENRRWLVAELCGHSAELQPIKPGRPKRWRDRFRPLVAELVEVLPDGAVVMI